MTGIAHQAILAASVMTGIAPSSAVASWVGGNIDTVNRADYSLFGACGADAADRAFVIVIEQRGAEAVDPDGVTFGTKVMTKLGGQGGNNINQSWWWLPGGELPTGPSATVAVDNPVSGGTRSMCKIDVFRVTGQTDTTPTWFNPVINGGSGTGLDLSPPETRSDGATIVAAAAPGSNASFTWAGATEAYDAATESSDCRVSGGVTTGLPAALTATTSGSVTDLMGAAVHIR